MTLTIRSAGDSDSAALIDLISRVFEEYPGCVMDVDGEMPHLRRPASAFAGWGGHLWVAETGGHVIGCAGFTDLGGVFELKHLYVDSARRGLGIASRLCDRVEAEAWARGRDRVVLWTDTRFESAHRLYARRGYARGPQTRALDDLSHSIEYYFELEAGRERGGTFA